MIDLKIVGNIFCKNFALQRNFLLLFFFFLLRLFIKLFNVNNLKLYFEPLFFPRFLDFSDFFQLINKFNTIIIFSIFLEKEKCGQRLSLLISFASLAVSSNFCCEATSRSKQRCIASSDFFSGNLVLVWVQRPLGYSNLSSLQ